MQHVRLPYTQWEMEVMVKNTESLYMTSFKAGKFAKWKKGPFFRIFSRWFVLNFIFLFIPLLSCCPRVWAVGWCLRVYVCVHEKKSHMLWWVVLQNWRRRSASLIRMGTGTYPRRSWGQSWSPWGKTLQTKNWRIWYVRWTLTVSTDTLVLMVTFTKQPLTLNGQYFIQRYSKCLLVSSQQRLFYQVW